MAIDELDGGGAGDLKPGQVIEGWCLQERLHERRLTLAVTPDARAWLAERGYDPMYGARPLRRLIQTEIQDRLARAILSGGVRDGDTVRVDVAADGSTLAILSEHTA